MQDVVTDSSAENLGKITRSAVVTGRACDRSLLSAGARWSRQRVTRFVTQGGAFRFVPAEGFSDLYTSRTKSQTALGRRAFFLFDKERFVAGLEKGLGHGGVLAR